MITECAVSTAVVFIAARFEPSANVDFTNIARHVINQVGYNYPDFNGKTCSILTSLRELPRKEEHCFDEKNLSDAEIEQIPVRNIVNVFGFACNQTPTLMPMPIALAHKLARQLNTVKLQKVLPYLAPDGKTQVGIEYKNRKPYRIHSIGVITSQNSRSTLDLRQLQEDIQTTVIDSVFQDEEIQLDAKTRIFINPDGPVKIGGPSVHSGMTGRKNDVDTYGEYAKHSGSALRSCKEITFTSLCLEPL